MARIHMIPNHNDCRNRRRNPYDKRHHQARQLDSITDCHITPAAWSLIYWKGAYISNWKLFKLGAGSLHIRRRTRDIPRSDRRISDKRLTSEVQLNMIKQ